MVETVHFISGLPRSGSTLLCALLRQNPLFHAAMTSPVCSLCIPLLKKMSGASEFHVVFDDERRRRILRALISAYYGDVPEGGIVFDTNRTWTSRAALTADLFPSSRIICCVRDIGWVIDSVERMLRKNPLQVSRLFNFDAGQSVYTRSEILMKSDTGLIGVAWTGLREAWFSDNADRLIVLDYERLARHPADVMNKLYAALGLEPYRHDFENVVYDAPEYDDLLGMPGMHKVARQVQYAERAPCIPPDLFAKHADLSFWRRPELNRRGAVIL